MLTLSQYSGLLLWPGQLRHMSLIDRQKQGSLTLMLLRQAVGTLPKLLGFTLPRSSSRVMGSTRKSSSHVKAGSSPTCSERSSPRTCLKCRTCVCRGVGQQSGNRSLRRQSNYQPLPHLSSHPPCLPTRLSSRRICHSTQFLKLLALNSTKDPSNRSLRCQRPSLGQPHTSGGPPQSQSLLLSPGPLCSLPRPRLFRHLRLTRSSSELAIAFGTLHQWAETVSSSGCRSVVSCIAGPPRCHVAPSCEQFKVSDIHESCAGIHLIL